MSTTIPKIPAPRRSAASRINWTAPTADVIIDGPNQLVALNLEPIAAAMLRDILRTLDEHPIARSAWRELSRTNPTNLLDGDAIDYMSSLVRWLSRSGALTITLDTDQAQALAGELDGAVMERNECRRCGNLIDSLTSDVCASCEEARA